MVLQFGVGECFDVEGLSISGFVRARTSFFTTSEMLVKYSKMPVENHGSGKKLLVEFLTSNLKYVHC